MKKTIIALAALAAACGAAVAHEAREVRYHVTKFAYGLKAKAGDMVGSYMDAIGARAYAFQTAVNLQMGFGVIGELAFEGPTRATTATIVHATAADIVVGRWYTYTSEGIVRPGGTGARAGILCNPKGEASFGQGGVMLAPGLVLPTGTVGEFLYMGAIIIAAPVAAALDAAVFYDNTTGVIGIGTAAGGQTQIANARIVRYPNLAAGLAVLEITQ